MGVYIDTCVCRDIVGDRYGHDRAVQVMNFCEEYSVKVVTSVFQRNQLEDQGIRDDLKARYDSRLTIACLDKAPMLRDRASNLARQHGLDWEDTVHLLLADKQECAYFITCNLQDYKDITSHVDTAVKVRPPSIANVWWNNPEAVNI